MSDSPGGTETSWLIINAGAPSCHPPVPTKPPTPAPTFTPGKPWPVTPDAAWEKRGAAAYAGLSRTDPDAVWSFQGWAFVDWKSIQQGSYLKGFIEAAPKGKFVVIDMVSSLRVAVLAKFILWFGWLLSP